MGEKDNGPPDGSDNPSGSLSGATVNTTGRPAVVSVTVALCPDRQASAANGTGYAPQTNADIAATGGSYKQAGYRDPDAGTAYQGLAFDLPRLRVGALQRGAHSGRADELRAPEPAPSTAAQRAARRNARKVERAAAAAIPVEPKRRKPRGRRCGALGFLDALKAA